MRYFSYIFPKRGRVSELLDLAVFTADPTEKWPAHITVAGPFATRPRPRKNNDFSARVSVVGVGNFFSSGQSTVFLRVGMRDLERYWNKPDFIGQAVPHLSIYNGKDRGFAKELYYRLLTDKVFFPINVRGVTIVNASSLTFDEYLRNRVRVDSLDITSGFRLDDFKAISKDDKIEIISAALRSCGQAAIGQY